MFPVSTNMTEERTKKRMTAVENKLWGLRQGGLRLERYVKVFLDLSNQVSSHDAALGVCFQLGLNDKNIHCDIPVGEIPLIELINLILFLNDSDFEVEEIHFILMNTESVFCEWDELIHIHI